MAQTTGVRRRAKEALERTTVRKDLTAVGMEAKQQVVLEAPIQGEPAAAVELVEAVA